MPRGCGGPCAIGQPARTMRPCVAAREISHAAAFPAGAWSHPNGRTVGGPHADGCITVFTKEVHRRSAYLEPPILHGIAVFNNGPWSGSILRLCIGPIDGR